MDGTTWAWIFFGAVAIVTSVVSLLYAFVPRGNNTSHCKTNDIKSYIIKHIDKFGLKNKGSSLDEDEIFLVEYNSMGL